MNKTAKIIFGKRLKTIQYNTKDAMSVLKYFLSKNFISKNF